MVMTMFVFFMHPAAASYDMREGLHRDYATEWLNMYILPNYDTSKIEQVNSTQSYSVEYDIGDPFTAEAEDIAVTLGSEFQGDFNIINNGIFHMVLVNDGMITGLYTNNDEVTVNSINMEGMDRASIHDVYGTPIRTVDKGAKHLIVENDEYDVFKIDDIYVYFFYDLHEADKVNGLLVAKASEMKGGNGMYNHPSVMDNEMMNYHLINAARLRYGARPLELHGGTGAAARKHSDDMAENIYFSHDSPDGGTLKDRILEEEFRFRQAGENIAMGHTSPIFSHHSLMNSKEHRVNTLNDSYTHVGIGVGYSAEEIPYYTENYIEK
ncbi:CAP domain-containing protein [Lacicoccus alkaliphilus]